MPNPWSKEQKIDEDAIETFQVPKNPSPAAELKETFSLDDERKKFKNHDLKSDIRLKRSYFSVTRKITRWWVRFIIAASALQFAARIFGKGLEAPEFIALITTTTATLVGFWAIVGAYLFPKRSNSD